MQAFAINNAKMGIEEKVLCVGKNANPKNGMMVHFALKNAVELDVLTPANGNQEQRKAMNGREFRIKWHATLNMYPRPLTLAASAIVATARL